MAADDIPPVVSVVLPVVGDNRLVLQAIRSVQAQALVDWELLVVLPTLSSPTKDALLALELADCRVRVLDCESTTNLATARNIALRSARGEWVSYLDCGDEYYSDYLVHVVELGKKADVIVFAYDVTEEDDQGRRQEATWNPALVSHELFADHVAAPLGVAHKRSLIEKAGLFQRAIVA